MTCLPMPPDAQSLAKIYRPEQDIRMHKVELLDGYSGRTFDTQVITPFMQKHFPTYAMRESAWLTRSLEQPHPFDENFPGRIRNKRVKQAFLAILKEVQLQPENVEPLLVLLFRKLRDATPEITIPILLEHSTFSIVETVQLIEQHVDSNYMVSGGSRLPVLAIYAVYQLIMNSERYQGKSLSALQSHTSADARSKGIGDIEVLNRDGSIFEAIEVKHDKLITAQMISIAYAKFRTHDVARYYILTTRTPNIDNLIEATAELERISTLHPCEIILNGVYPTLKYLLRIAPSSAQFLQNYTDLMHAEYNSGGAIKADHLHKWEMILSH